MLIVAPGGKIRPDHWLLDINTRLCPRLKPGVSGVFFRHSLSGIYKGVFRILWGGKRMVRSTTLFPPQ